MNPTVGIPTRLLVLGMLGEDGSLRMDELVPIASACGSGPEQLRSCLRRLVAEGVLGRNGAGRRARYQATPAGLGAMHEQRARLRRGYDIDRGAARWDGLWHLVAFAIPESERAARDAFRDRLRILGGASIQGGLYVSATAWEPDVAAAAKEVGVEGFVTKATSDDLCSGGVREPRELARRLWRLDEVSARYAAFVALYAPVIPALSAMRARREALPDEAFLPGALAMAVAFTPCFDADPLLPAALLPQPWPGSAARELLIASRGLALELREAQGRPRLFHFFDEETTNSCPSLAAVGGACAPENCR
jgi:phenylacetic acid degradation operon negative regulatory protein